MLAQPPARVARRLPAAGAPRPHRPGPKGAVIAGALCLGAVAASVTCGGTTGREGLTTAGSDAGGSDAAPGSLDLDAEAFDVGIVYDDRALPDVTAPVDAGPGAGPGWPICPPFIPVDQSGNPVALGQELDQVPAVIDDAGQPSIAPDGSPCATYGWLGSPAIDDCVTSQTSGGQNDFIELPPCNWAVEAGVAAQGTGAGETRVSLCLALYACITTSGCGARNISSCLCGPDTNSTDCVKSPAGPCMSEEMAALELPAASVQDALKNYFNGGTSFLGYSGGLLNAVFLDGQSYSCFADAGH
jgi:hypothetical protein